MASNERGVPSEAPKEVREVVEGWLDAYRTGDVDSMISLLAPDVLSVGTGSDEMRYSAEELRRGLMHDFTEARHLEMRNVEITSDARNCMGWAFIDADYVVDITGEKMTIHGRRSLVLEKRGGCWLIVHIHFSYPSMAQPRGRSFPVERSMLERYRLLSQYCRDIILFVDEDGIIVEANSAAGRAYGVLPSRLVSMRITDLMDREQAARYEERVRLCGGRGDLFEAVHLRNDGSSFPVEISLEEAEVADRKFFLNVIRDISERKKAEYNLRISDERLHQALKATSDCVWDWDVSTGYVFISEGWVSILADSIEGGTYRFEFLMERIHPEDRPDVEMLLKSHLHSGGAFGVEYRIGMVGGGWRWVLIRGGVIEFDEQGRALRMVGTIIDIDERKKMEEERRLFEEELKRLASTDKLTGLLNRQKFEVIMEEEMERSRRYGTPLSLIMFDLDRFKTINDTLGHSTGDRVLAEVCRVLGRSLRKNDHFARWGGDEFMILTPLGDDGALRLAERLRAVLGDVSVEGVSRISASFGIVRYRWGMTIEELTDRADEAMYRAKDLGGDEVEIFSIQRISGTEE